MVTAETIENSMPPVTLVHKLNERATARLAEITRYTAADGYDDAELVAARSLLDKGTRRL